MANSDELIKKQRKLTTAANTIEKELMTFTADAELLSDEQKNTLREAVKILRESKERYEHKKEKQIRAEKKRTQQLKAVADRNGRIANKIIADLGIRSRAALSFYQYRPYSTEDRITLRPETKVSLYHAQLLERAREDHDQLLILISDINRQARENFLQVVIPESYVSFRGSFRERDFDPHYYTPEELSYDQAVEILKADLSHHYSEEVQQFIDDVVKLVDLSNEVTQSLLDIFAGNEP